MIGCIAAWIAYNRFLVIKAKLNLDLFEKRIDVFNKVWGILSSVVTVGIKAKNYGLSNPFNNLLPSALFLFGKEMEEYLAVCVKNWAALDMAETCLHQSNNTPQQTQEHAKLKADMFGWFANEAMSGAKKRFDPYLDFQDWK